MTDLRLAVPAAVMWAVAVLIVALPDAAQTAAAVAWLIVGASAAIALAGVVRRAGRDERRPPSKVRSLLWAVRGAWMMSAVSAVVVALVFGAVARDAPRRAPDALSHAAAASSSVTLAIRTDRTPQGIASGFDGRPRWMWKGTARFLSDEGGDRRLDAPVTVIATMSTAEARAIAFGSLVRVAGTVRANDPGDTTGYLVNARSSPQVVSGPEPLIAWTDALRHGFASAAAATPGDGGALLPGLSIGDVSAVGGELDAAMKASALSHLTAVSGANCALVTGIVFMLGGLIGVGRTGRVVLSLGALLAFVVLVTPGASVVRAATMAVIVLIALARGRPAQGLPVLSLAVIVLLMNDPWLSRDFGFALSVLATAGLLLLAGPLARFLAQWMPRSLAAIISIPFAAQLACQPVLIVLNPNLPLYGVAANLLAGPAAPAATIVGLLACLFLPLAPVLAHALIWTAWSFSAWIAAVARTTAALPASSLPWVGGPIGVVLCALALVAVAVLVLGGRPLRRSIAATAAAVTLVAGAGIYAGALGGSTIGRGLTTPRGWQIAACDVGQGDAILFHDQGRFAMIDVGRTPGPAGACLDRLGVERLDLLVLTHYDADHVGGLEAVIGRVGTALVGPPDGDAHESAIARLETAGARIVHAEAGVSGSVGELAWRVLWPPAAAVGVPSHTGNAGSVTLAVEGRGLRSVHLGDLGEREQDALLASGEVGEADVVKVAHHGSADQSPALYRAIRARLGLLSVGAKNGYGHPTARVFDLLEAAGTATARTDRNGLILVSPGATPGALSVWTEHPDEVGDARVGPRPARTDDGGSPYAGEERGGTWRHEAAAGRARVRGERRRRSRRWRGTRFGRPPSCSSPVPRAFWPTGPSVRSVTRSRRRIRASKSAISPPTITRRASC